MYDFTAQQDTEYYVFTTKRCLIWKIKSCSPSICFWQSFSASADWRIHVCSCRARCLQRSWKWLKSSPFRIIVNNISHIQTQPHRLIYICMCSTLEIILYAVFLFAPIVYFHPAKTALINGLKVLQELFHFLSHSSWYLCMKPCQWNPFLSVMTPVTCVTNHIFVSVGPPAQDQKGPLPANRFIRIGQLSWRRQPTPARSR